MRRRFVERASLCFAQTNGRVSKWPLDGDHAAVRPDRQWQRHTAAATYVLGRHVRRLQLPHGVAQPARLSALHRRRLPRVQGRVQERSTGHPVPGTEVSGEGKWCASRKKTKKIWSTHSDFLQQLGAIYRKQNTNKQKRNGAN